MKKPSKNEGDSLREDNLEGILQKSPLQWSPLIASRVALRAIPSALMLTPRKAHHMFELMKIFRANALAHIAAEFPSNFSDVFAQRADQASNDITEDESSSPVATTAALAVRVSRDIIKARRARNSAKAAPSGAARTLLTALAATIVDESVTMQAVSYDLSLLREGVAFQHVARLPLWHDLAARPVFDAWLTKRDDLLAHNDQWSIWTNWYDDLLDGRPHSEEEDAAYTDVPGPLPWQKGIAETNHQIAVRLSKLTPDPAFVEGIASPIAINRLQDGRIGIETGPFSLPTVPPPSTDADHAAAQTACQTRALQLRKIALSPSFQGRSDYAEVLADYLDWLPNETGAGNMLLADGEARTLNKLYTAEASILPVNFASKLSVLLEDHIGLRSFYPEVQRHYEAVNTGRMIKPLPRDAVEAIQIVIRSQTPAVFAETISPAIAEASKPQLEIKALPPAELPPPDPTLPKPPNDPISVADPRKSQGFILASAYNRIWELLSKGKDTAQAIEGWQKTYALLKPHIGPIIDFLRSFLEGGGQPPSLPPTTGA